MRSQRQRGKGEVRPLLANAAILATAALQRALGSQQQKHLSSRSAEPCLGKLGATADKAEPAVRARTMEAYSKLPLSFEFNEGQPDQGVKFLSYGSGLFAVPDRG